MMQEAHIFTGMSRANHPSAQNAQSLWDAHNIRITTRDGSEMMAIANEKSTKRMLTFGKHEKYVGHAVCGEYLVVFVHNQDPANIYDIIYRIRFDSMNKEILYKGTNLGFDTDMPIQTIYSYETDLIQKVYWVDGKHQPRVINITKPELLGHHYDNTIGYSGCYSEAPFDFVQELKLKEEVEVTRNDYDNGIFSPGVIQYAFTYYFKYGQESNIFYVTEPLYIAHNSRGAPADSRVNCSFTINIKGIESRFEYIRIYSIIRTSIDATPTVKRVKDIKIDNITIKDDNSLTYLYTDTNTEGDIIDNNQLLYVGGKDIIANCIHSKDSTLFLGDVKYNRITPYDKVDTNRTLSDIVANVGVGCDTRKIEIKSDDTSFYKYTNQLFTNTSTFKWGDHYRLGVQLQYKNGEWSEPIPIKNGDTYEHTMSSHPDIVPSSNKGKNNLVLPVFKGKFKGTDNDISIIESKDYVKIRPIIVPPSVRDRKILAQGILCPTVYSAQNRFNNSPYAQSSWLIRPFVTASLAEADIQFVEKGVIAAFEHERPLYGQGRACEVQSMLALGRNTDWPKVKKQMEDFDFRNGGMYFVDQSILTFHSPDLDSDGELNFSEGDQLKVGAIGLVEWSSNYGDIDIQTSSGVINTDAKGFFHMPALSPNFGGRSLISGLFYEDSAVQYKSKSFEKTDSAYHWMVYMWNRSGSLNNDIERGGEGTRTSVLRKKVISNIKVSNETHFFNAEAYEKHRELNTSPIEVFNSNEVEQVKLKIKDKDTGYKTVTYFGNIDSLTGGTLKNRLEIGNNDVPSILIGAGTYNGTVDFNLATEGYNDFKGTPTVPGTYSKSTWSLINVKITQIDNSSTYKVSGEVSSVNGHPLIIRGSALNLAANNGTVEFTGTVLSTESTEDSQSMVKLTSLDSTVIVCHQGNSTQVVTGINGTIAIITELTKPTQETTGRAAFNSGLSYVDEVLRKVLEGTNTYPDLKNPVFPVRVKYKSTPHAVFALLNDEGNPEPINNVVTGIYNNYKSFSYLAEIHQNPTNPFGNIEDNMWIPAGKSITLEEFKSNGIQWIYGDTWYQRWDCLKTYPFTHEDENQVIEIGSFMCETRINIDGRTDRNRGLLSNLTVSPTNFNLMNKVYSQSNNFFNYRRLDNDFYKLSSFPSQVLWGNTKIPSNTIDDWTNIHLANSLNLDGNYGKVTSLNSFGDTLIGFQEHAINNILFNSRVQIETTDGVPIEIANNNKVEGTRFISNTVGCQDKFSIVSGGAGLYFVDYETGGLYCISEALSNIGLTTGMNSWLNSMKCGKNWRYELHNPTSVPNTYNGIRLFYDPINYDVYFIPGQDRIIHGGKPTLYNRVALGYSEQTQSFISTYDYGGSVMMFGNSKIYSLADDKEGNLTLWENFSDNGYGTIFDVPRSYSISFIANDNPMITKIFDSVEFKGDLFDTRGPIIVDDNHYMVRNETETYGNTPFDTIEVTNEYQDTSAIPFNKLSLRRKFRYWRGLIPRQIGSRARIRSPWCKVTLTKEPVNKKATIYGVAVNYTT